MVDRPDVPDALVDRIDDVLSALRGVRREGAWTGVRWRVRTATIAHVFGGEDRLFRVVFRGEPEEVTAFEHLGHPYFRAGWGENVIGMVVDDATDWDELAEMLADSHRLQSVRR